MLAKGPLLLACNHPNSFLDGIILTTLFKENVYSLARGDAFQVPRFNRILRSMNLLPVYRTSESVENLEYNYTTFDTCKKVFSKNGIVIIFSEGRCINEWHLRPLKKGTARLAASAWESNIDLMVLPVGLNYNAFRNFGKNVHIKFGEPLNRDSVMAHQTDGKMFLTFNEELKAELQKLVYEIDPSDKKALYSKLSFPVAGWKWMFLGLPSLAGFLLHAPLYFTAKGITKKYFDNDHFDSCLVSILMLSYPLYMVLWFAATNYFFGWRLAILVFISLPFFAWSCVQLKPQN